MSEKIETEIKDLCCEANSNGLRYTELSVVMFDIFTFVDSCERCTVCGINNEIIEFGDYVKSLEGKPGSTIDKQMFVYGNNESPLHKYKLEGFTFKLKLNEPEPVLIEGKVYVEMSLFYYRTVSMTYRMVINNEEDFMKSPELTTDHIISLISVYMDAENWAVGKCEVENCEKWETEDCEENEKKICKKREIYEKINGVNYGSISLEIESLEIDDLYLDSNGAWTGLNDREKVSQNIESLKADTEECLKENQNHNLFKEVIKRYKKHILGIRSASECKSKVKKDSDKVLSSKHVYVDIWESVQHYDDLFIQDAKKSDKMDERDILSHIAEFHKRELIGLMTLYPFEWPYRDASAYDVVCGGNIAIDSDDLVLSNQKITVVIGTYGLRDEPSSIDWKNHLKVRKQLHVSWPEHLLILEMLLLKKHTLMCARNAFINTALSDETNNNLTKAISKNAEQHLDIINLIAKLDAVDNLKFMSHQIMLDKTAERLNLKEEKEAFDETLEKVDSKLGTIRETRSIQQGDIMNIVLLAISVISLFQLIFATNEIPILNNLLYPDASKVSSIIADVVIMTAGCLFIVGLCFMIKIAYNLRKNNRRRKK